LAAARTEASHSCAVAELHHLYLHHCTPLRSRTVLTISTMSGAGENR
jgi:hypothetical protein